MPTGCIKVVDTFRDPVFSLAPRRTMKSWRPDSSLSATGEWVVAKTWSGGSRSLRAERAQKANDPVRLQPVLEFVNDSHGGCRGRFPLEPSHQQPGRTRTQPAQRNTLVVVERDGSAGKGHGWASSSAWLPAPTGMPRAAAVLSTMLRSSSQLADALLTEPRSLLASLAA